MKNVYTRTAVLTGLSVLLSGPVMAGLARASIDSDQDKLDFDAPVNKKSDFNEGCGAKDNTKDGLFVRFQYVF